MLKDEGRNLYHDVEGLWQNLPPQEGDYRARDCQWWDSEGLLSWPQAAVPLRAVRSIETWQHNDFSANGKSGVNCLSQPWGPL